MKLIFFVCCVVAFSKLDAQTALKIEYKQTFLDGKKEIVTSEGYGNKLINSLGETKIRMIVNDSFGFIHHFQKGYDPLKGKKLIGDKLIHHSIFLDFSNLNYYHECSYPKNDKFLIEFDNTLYPNWEILTDEKTILGNRCRAALSVDENNDSTLVWFTSDLKFKKGFLFYEGIPGVVLEASSQKYEGIKYIATKIEEIDMKITRPTEGVTISRKEFIALRKK